MMANRKKSQETTQKSAPTSPPKIEWWRFKRADDFDDGSLQELRTAIGKLDMLGEPLWKSAVAGDAASAIDIVFRMHPLHSPRLRFDLAMTALVVCAAVGDPSACLVTASVLRRAPGSGKAEARIATSWLVKAFGKIASRRSGGVDSAVAEDLR